ncbi:MAG: molybdopterin-synthase adenylyltransferase MoeB [Planctomycetota bacterium]
MSASTDITLRIPAPLRRFTGGVSKVAIRGDELRGALEGVRATHPELIGNVLDEDGELRTFVHLFVDGKDVAKRDGLETNLDGVSVITILPAVAGGALSLKDERLDELRSTVEEIETDEAFELLESEPRATLLDIREKDEVERGSPLGARRLGRGFLELRVEDVVPERDAPLLVLCQGGVRSLFAADSLARLGYRDVRSVAGGFAAWEALGLPTEAPRTLSSSEVERYARHLSVPEVGEEGQAKLLSSSVLLIGAGGLGSPTALYLAAAGVGHLTIVDDDVVDRSNLQRQILHTDASVGDLKVDSVAQTLLALNPDIEVERIPERLTVENAVELVGRHDVVVDGTDNFATRYLVNDAAVAGGVPNVHGSIFRFEGQVSVFAPSLGGPCYRCVYPTPPPADLAPGCSEAGVLGVLPGVVGTLEAVEVIKLLLGVGDPLVGRLLHYDALSAELFSYEIGASDSCERCSSEAARRAPVRALEAASCSIRDASAPVGAAS